MPKYVLLSFLKIYFPSRISLFLEHIFMEHPNIMRSMIIFVIRINYNIIQIPFHEISFNSPKAGFFLIRGVKGFDPMTAF